MSACPVTGCTRPSGHTGRHNNQGHRLKAETSGLSDQIVAAITTVCDQIGIRHERIVIDGIEGRLICGPGGEAVLITTAGHIRPVEIRIGEALTV